MIAVEPSSLERAGWQAKLELGFERVGARTVLGQRAHVGPLRVQRPFYPEGPELCHVYVLHPPGGVVGGDSLGVEVQVKSGAQVLLTTPAATKFYRSNGRRARQEIALSVERGAACEWLPQETIVFGGVLAESRTRVELEAGARFAGWEITCLGRPAAGDGYATGSYRASFEVWEQGAPLWIDRAWFAADTGITRANWGMRGFSVLGTFVMNASGAELVRSIRQCAAAAEDSAEECFAVSALERMTVCRYFGHHSQRALECFTRVWQVARPLISGRTASAPRVWLT
jgi:urease accessory protein